MSNRYSGGTNLDSIFEPRDGRGSAQSTGHFVGSQDLGDRYLAKSKGMGATASGTGIFVGSSDLNQLFTVLGDSSGWRYFMPASIRSRIANAIHIVGGDTNSTGRFAFAIKENYSTYYASSNPDGRIQDSFFTIFYSDPPYTNWNTVIISSAVQFMDDFYHFPTDLLGSGKTWAFANYSGGESLFMALGSNFQTLFNDRIPSGTAHSTNNVATTNESLSRLNAAASHNENIGEYRASGQSFGRQFIVAVSIDTSTGHVTNVSKLNTTSYTYDAGINYVTTVNKFHTPASAPNYSKYGWIGGNEGKAGYIVNNPYSTYYLVNGTKFYNDSVFEGIAYDEGNDDVLVVGRQQANSNQPVFARGTEKAISGYTTGPQSGYGKHVAYSATENLWYVVFSNNTISKDTYSNIFSATPSTLSTEIPNYSSGGVKKLQTLSNGRVFIVLTNGDVFEKV